MALPNLTVRCSDVDVNGAIAVGGTECTALTLGNGTNCATYTQAVDATGTLTQTFGTGSTQIVASTTNPPAGTVNSQEQTVLQNYPALYARTTDAATATTIATIPVPSGHMVVIAAHVFGRDVTGGTVGDLASFNQSNSGFSNVAGTVHAAATQPAIGTAHDASMVTTSLSFVVSGQNVLLQVNGLASVTIDWTANIQVFQN